jgi:protein-S-isoprenylcysteine O-methyltransferase Ste14
MTEYQVYMTVLYAFIGVAVVTFISLFFITAPYGRHTKKGWGPLINNTAAWVVMEVPASLLFFVYFLIADRSITATLVALQVIWQIHYFHRAFIFPFMLRSDEKVPLSIIMFGMMFNSINTYIQGRWVYGFSPESMYAAAWLADPRFIIGAVIFAAGFFINKQSDAITRRLWDPQNPGYKIPYGGLYRYVSCPNYFGEIVTWIGWAVMTWSLAGLFFVIWTAANLVPRARANHRWYLEKFPDYPKERKAIIPYVY